MAANRALRRKREAALAKARRKAQAAVDLLEATDPDDDRYHERRVFAEAFTGVVGVMEAKIRADAR